MDTFEVWKRIIVVATVTLVCTALVGGIYFWYEMQSLTNSADTGHTGVTPAPTPVAYSTSTLEASQQSLQKSVQASATTTASPAALQASQAALQKAVQNNKAPSGGAAPSNTSSSNTSAAQQTELQASQQALEKAVQQSKGQ